MRFVRTKWGTVVIAVLAVVLLSTAAWAASGGDSTPRAGIDADTVDGHHAGPSYGSKQQRANRVLWADGRGKIGAKSLPFNAIDKRYLSAREDTFFYVPGALAEFHMDDGNKASMRVNNSGQAIIRPINTGRVDMVVPIPLTAMQSGSYVKLVNMRVYYKVDTPASYIDFTNIHMIAANGSHHRLGSRGTDAKSTTWSSFVVECSDPACQLSWPAGGFITAIPVLQFGGTGAAHEITIGGVLMRVSYDG
jgi:hypothetical protein